MTAIHELGTTALAEAYRARTLSPVDVVDALLERIDEIDLSIHAFITVDRDGARAAARAAERAIRSGNAKGPLHGIPVAVKDCIDVAGLPTTCHSRILLGGTAGADAAVVARLRAAGAIILGKLALHEFALGGPSFDLPFPPARNPWNLAHHPGGSSSGAGAGLAARLFPLALGTDTAGSVRHPAAACGVVGLKPTYDRVPRDGVFPLAWSLDHVGPMARTVTDCALLLDAMTGASTTGLHDEQLVGLRVGFVRAFHETDMQADPEVGAALERAASLLARDGATVRDVSLPKLQAFAAANRTTLVCEAWSLHARWLRERPEDYAASTRRRILPGAFLAAEDYADAQQIRYALSAAVDDTFAECDVLLLANALDPPCRVDNAAELERTYPRQARSPFNLSGHPAIAVPAGLSRSGLPLSVQFAAPRFQESALLRVAAAFERRAGFESFSPPALSGALRYD